MSPDATSPLPRDRMSADRRTRSLAELAAVQGVIGPQDFDALFGAGSELWDDDVDFEAFLAGLRESRRTGD